MTRTEAKELISKWMDEQIGYTETPVNKNKYAAYLDSLGDFYNGKKDGYAWCDVYVDCGFVEVFGEENAKKMLYQPAKSLGAGCEFSARYYKNNGAFFSTPEWGDQIFFKNYDHTGFVRQVTDAKVITIEGNTGDKVVRKEYNRNDPVIIGYGRPDWDVVKNMSVEPYVEIPILLKQGNRSNAVYILQMGLIKRGYDIYGGADGYFGQYTKAALVSYQTANGLIADGSAGTETFNKLLSKEG